MMDIRPIHNDADLEWALKEVEPYFENEPVRGSDEGNRFEVLTAVIMKYENEVYPIQESDPIKVLHYAIAQLGRTQADLGYILGSRSRASEILARKRHLTLPQIRSISAAWSIPIGALTASYDVVREANAASSKVEAKEAKKTNKDLTGKRNVFGRSRKGKKVTRARTSRKANVA